MNLHQIVSGAINAVNPFEPIQVQVSAGNTTNPDGTRSPQYRPPVTVSGQIQSLTFRDIQMVEGLNLQGERRAIYLNGHIDGLVREENKGGDIVTMKDGTKWLVAIVLEHWADWCKVAVTRQNP